MREIVIIFPFNTREQKILVIEEYIHHYNRSFWKYVSGGVDKEEKDFITHAKEELAEEVGMSSEGWHHFHQLEKIFGNREIHFFMLKIQLKWKTHKRIQTLISSYNLFG